jgi:hypothetical protein
MKKAIKLQQSTSMLIEMKLVRMFYRNDLNDR